MIAEHQTLSMAGGRYVIRVPYPLASIDVEEFERFVLQARRQIRRENRLPSPEHDSENLQRIIFALAERLALASEVLTRTAEREGERELIDLILRVRELCSESSRITLVKRLEQMPRREWADDLCDGRVGSNHNDN